MILKIDDGILPAIVESIFSAAEDWYKQALDCGNYDNINDLAVALHNLEDLAEVMTQIMNKNFDPGIEYGNEILDWYEEIKAKYGDVVRQFDEM